MLYLKELDFFSNKIFQIFNIITNIFLYNENVLNVNNNVQLLIEFKKKDRNIPLNNRIKYSNKNLNFTIIEILQEDPIFKKITFLKIDDYIMDNNSESNYINQDICILQIPQKEGISFSQGKIKFIKKENIFYLVSANNGSGGSPILLLNNFKIIGIHIGRFDNIRFGTFMKNILYDINNIKFIIPQNINNVNNEIKKELTDITSNNYFEQSFFKVNEITNDNNLISLGKYKYEEKIIGKGGFGRVFKGIDENNNQIAIKQIDLEDGKRQEIISLIKNEINIMKIMQKDNKYSVKYIDSIEKNCYFYIIMEYCDNTLEKKIKEEKGLKMNIIQNILKQLNKNLKKLNELKIIHKDIKPENILIKYKDINKNLFDIKLNDYGLSKRLSKKYDSEFSGDKRYIAPEADNYKINNKSDLWSIGIMIYEMYFNKLPFKNNKLDIKKSGNLEFDDLISKLIVIDYKKRIEWKDYYEHNFFYEIY